MTIIATARATSTAHPSAFFARWADTATWPEWNTDTEWVRLDVNGHIRTALSGELVASLGDPRRSRPDDRSTASAAPEGR